MFDYIHETQTKLDFILVGPIDDETKKVSGKCLAFHHCCGHACILGKSSIMVILAIFWGQRPLIYSAQPSMVDDSILLVSQQDLALAKQWVIGKIILYPKICMHTPSYMALQNHLWLRDAISDERKQQIHYKFLEILLGKTLDPY